MMSVRGGAGLVGRAARRVFADFAVITGFFLGIIYLITRWYLVEERSVRIAFVLASATEAGAFGGCIAYGVGHLNGDGGLEGFIIEGIITVLCVVLVLMFLPDYPALAKWLSSDDKKYIEEGIAVKGGGYTKQKSTRHEVMETVFSPRMLAHYFAYVSLFS
jgi:hypothetical protein